MHNWLEEQANIQKNKFTLFIEKTWETIKEIKDNDPSLDLHFKVIFDKDEWLVGKAQVEILQYVKKDEYKIVSYEHSCYDTEQDIPKKGIIPILVNKGILTNTWFSVLDSARVYNTTIEFNNDSVIFENTDCEDLENRFKATHYGLMKTTSKLKK